MPESMGSILYVGGFELPDRNAAAHRVLNNAKVLRDLGFNVVLCGADHNQSEIGKKTSVSGFDSISTLYPNSSKQWIHRMFSIKDYIEIISRYSDIKYVICYNLHAIPMLKLLHYCNKRNIVLISDCTEWYENKFSFNPIECIKCIDTFLSMRFIQKKCKGLIAISSYLADYYKKSVKNVIVIPPLFDLNEEKFLSTNKKAGNDEVTIVYAGSPSASKEALGDVVKSLNKLTDLKFKFIIVGITLDEFKKIYSVLPNTEKIEFLGKVSHKDALQTVITSDYAVIIRPKNRVTMAGFPTKFAEAISGGTAAIVNDTSDVVNYLEDGRNGYVVSLDNLEEDFRKIISSNEKKDVNTDLFNYKNYYEAFRSFFENLK